MINIDITITILVIAITACATASPLIYFSVAAAHKSFFRLPSKAKKAWRKCQVLCLFNLTYGAADDPQWQLKSVPNDLVQLPRYRYFETRYWYLTMTMTTTGGAICDNWNLWPELPRSSVQTTSAELDIWSQCVTISPLSYSPVPYILSLKLYYLDSFWWLVMILMDSFIFSYPIYPLSIRTQKRSSIFDDKWKCRLWHCLSNCTVEIESDTKPNVISDNETS